ncbi:MAG TPA: hypothetical protein VJM83_04230, partial [Nitrospirota bacterium]|nr:hypothetical protein [Nitrospirota bacterium]
TVNFYEYTSVGHGKKGSYRYSGRAGANKGCTDCHVSTSPHGSTFNPFRLYSTGSVKPSQPDTLCLQGGCHTTAPVNHDFSHVGGSVTTWYFTPKCIDCHDPHGDSGGNDTTQRNYQMIQGFVNYSGASSAQGVPSGTPRAMDFPAETTRPGSKTRVSYVTATYDGICQICHKRGNGAVGNTANAAYFNRATNNESTHNSGQLCMGCHGHTGGFKGAGGDCKACHGTGGSGTTAGRANIETEFAKKSHHVKANWTQISSKHCATCHAEGTSTGGVNSTYHEGAGGKAVSLRVWTAAFTNLTGMTTPAWTFVAYSTGTGSVSTSVSNSTKVTSHCASCHRTSNASSQPFKLMGVNDTSTPGAYDVLSGGASAGSVFTRYSSPGTTNFSKYDPANYNVVPQIPKAYSPHGNPSGNQRGKAKLGYWADDAGNNRKTGCFDCHNSHGSSAGSGSTLTKMLSYSSAVGGWYGGVIKQTSAYTPAEGSSAGYSTSNIVYSASADLCWDCHLADDANAPLNFRSAAFNIKSSIDGYWDRGRWKTTDVWTGSFAYKTAQASGRGHGGQKGGHFGGYSSLRFGNVSSHRTIEGRCTVCHDPHGVNTAKTDSQYMVPALKGTWLTSPYKEDRVASVSATTTQNSFESRFTASVGMKPSRLNPRFDWNNPAYVGGGYGRGGSATNWGRGSNGADGYYIDDNTFGTNITYGNAGVITDGTTAIRYTNVTARRMTQTVAQFAGLCTTCHTPSKLQSVTYSNGTTANIHPHNTVKGWYNSSNASDLFRNWAGNVHEVASYTTAGSDIRCTNYVSDTNENMPSGYRWSVKTGTYAVDSPARYTVQPPTPVASTQSTRGYVQPGYHKFPCSKCHTAHTSKLPRLMRTNCIDVGGARTGPRHNTGYTYPNCDSNSTVGTGKWYMMECHNLKQENTPNGNGWNTKTGW